jgi:hypothetical protein
LEGRKDRQSIACLRWEMWKIKRKYRRSRDRVVPFKYGMRRRGDTYFYYNLIK